MAAEAFVQVQTDGAGKQIDCGPAPLSDGSGNNVYRQVGTLGDPALIGAIANVKAATVAATTAADAALVVTIREGLADRSGVAITGATMPTGGVGLTGWLSAIWKALTGTINVSSTASNPSSIYVNELAPGITAFQLPSQALVNGVVITALSSNTATIFVGSSSAVSNLPGLYPRYPLVAGQSISAATTNLNAVWLIGNNTSDAVSIMGN